MKYVFIVKCQRQRRALSAKRRWRSLLFGGTGGASPKKFDATEKRCPRFRAAR
ncbi:hypothetical protein RintRC_5249 [Richelia intracellularis]|nr:hypothetical protein RintRC_5249 [Richelia intracellularis]